MAADAPGSRWWRAMNERLVRDGCEAVARAGGRRGARSSPTIKPWTTFISHPTAHNWYRAHNASIVAAYLEHRDLAELENRAERFFLNVVLLRVLYAHALVAAPRLALGPLAPLGRVLGDPRLGMAGVFLSLGRVLPDRYPLPGELEDYLRVEHGLGRMLDYAVIGPRLAQLYDWSAGELGQPGLRDLIRDDVPAYVWPAAERHLWDAPPMNLSVVALRMMTTARQPAGRPVSAFSGVRSRTPLTPRSESVDAAATNDPYADSSRHTKVWLRMMPSGIQSSGRTRNRRGEGVRLRGEIVAAAGRLLDQTGRREAVTLRAVAREVGITPMSIYAHFPDPEAILAEVLKETLREIAAAMTTGDDALPDPVDRLLARCAAYMAFARARPQRFGLLDSFVHGTEAPEEARAAFGAFVSGVGDCVAAGRSQSVDPFTDATAVWVAVHGYATLRAHHPDFPWPATEAAWIQDIVLRLGRVSIDDRASS